MPTFKYKAIKKSGETYFDTANVSEENDLVNLLKEKGDALVWSEEKKKSAIVLWSGKIKNEDKIVFAKNLGAMIGAGLSVSKALTTLEKQFRNPKFKETIKNININIKKGNSIHSSLALYPDIFSSLFVSMVRAGEESGKIADSLKIVCGQMENANNLKKKVKGALIYPIIILVAMTIVGVLMLVFIVPTLQATFADMKTELPVSTQMIVSASAFIRDHTILFFLGAALFFGLGVAGFKTKKGRMVLDTVSLKIPVVSGIVKDVNSARTARTLSSLLSSGVDVVSAFDITRDVIQNNHYKKILLSARDNIQKGMPIASVFTENENLYPPIMGAMVEVGEETGKLSEMLLSVADFYEGEVSLKTKNMSTIIEPVLMVFIGLAVGFFAVSMISPMYSLMENI